MAESSDVNKFPEEILDIITKRMVISDQICELEKELAELKSCEVLKEENERLEKVIEGMESMKSTFQLIADSKTLIAKRLSSPLVPNALPIESSQQENFVTCCKKLPLIAKKFEVEQDKLNGHEKSDALPNEHILAKNMEKEGSAIEAYMSHAKRFQSANEEMKEKINKIVALVDKRIKTD